MHANHKLNPMERLWRIVPHIFGLDVRSLAAFRMASASTLFYVLFTRLADLEALYSDNGVVKRSDKLEATGSSLSLCFHMVSGNPTIITLLFAAHFAALVCMFLGYKTRAATLVCWLLEMSLQNRNSMVTQGGDNVCRYVCMYGVFLPLGSVWSLDEWLRVRQRKRKKKNEKEKEHINIEPTQEKTSSSCSQCSIQTFFDETSPPPSAEGLFYSNHNLVCSLGTAAIALQVTLLYWNAGLLKHKANSWYKDMTALEFALHTDGFTTWVGVLMRQLPEGALMFLTYSSLMLELWAPAFVLLPLSLYNRELAATYRGVGVLSFLLFHIGIRAALDIGHFSAISMCMWVVFIPGDFWEGRGKCCTSWISPKSLSSNDRPPALSLVLPTDMGTTTRPAHSPKPLFNAKLSRKPTWENILLGIMIYVVLSENVGSYYREERDVYLPVRGAFSFLSYGMQLRQSWGMFTNMGTFRRDGWYETVGELRGNTTVDLMGWGGPVPRKLRFQDTSDYSDPTLVPQARGQGDRPESFSRRFASQRWRKYIMHLRNSRHAVHRLAYGKYLCRAWNGPGYTGEEEDMGQLLRFKILFHSEPQVHSMDAPGRTLIAGKHKGNDTKIVTLHSHRCFANE
jgi:hypothetical protein